MPIELEAKFAVDAHEPVRDRLETLGARFVGRVLETNSTHDHRDGRLRGGGCVLRVRGIEVLDGEPRSPRLTFKGPVQRSRFKKRQEIELPLTDADAMRRLLEAIGLAEIFRFQKHRESWRLDDSRVELDEVPRLGRFVEIEAPSESEVRSVQDALGLADAKHITRGYVGLLMD